MNFIFKIKSLINTVRFIVIFKKNKHKNELLEFALRERGVLYKLIQNFSPELMGNSVKSIQPLSKNEIIRIIESDFKIKFFEHFTAIDDAFYCASIGQVQRGFLKNGTAVAIKVQYPDVKSSVNTQLQILKLAAKGAKFTKMSNWNFNISSHLEKIEERLNQELDYQHEIHNLYKYSINNPFAKTKIFNQYCSSFIITQSWIEGAKLLLIKNKF